MDQSLHFPQNFMIIRIQLIHTINGTFLSFVIIFFILSSTRSLVGDSRSWMGGCVLYLLANCRVPFVQVYVVNVFYCLLFLSSPLYHWLFGGHTGLTVWGGSTTWKPPEPEIQLESAFEWINIGNFVRGLIYDLDLMKLLRMNINSHQLMVAKGVSFWFGFWMIRIKSKPPLSV